MNLKTQRAATVQAAQDIVAKAKAENRDLTKTEVDQIEAHVAEVKSIDKKIEGQATMDAIGKLWAGEDTGRKHLALIGRGAKAAAHAIVEGMVDGTKALVPAGTVTTTVPTLETITETGRPLGTLLEALPLVQHATPTYRYLRQTARTNNAAPVAVGGTKPTSVMSLTPVDSALTVIAHMSEPVDKYVLQDNGSLQRFVSAELLYMLGAKIEDQVLNGSGTAPNLRGILNTSGIQTQAYVTGRLETLRAAITALETSGYEASTIVLSPTDWAAIETTRAGTSGTFDLGGPIDRAARRVWGVPVVTANALTAGTGLVFDDDALAVATDTAGIETRWSDATADDFSKNQLRARVEGRFGLDVYQPAAIVKATLTAA